MNIIVVGGGAVGKSITRDLLNNTEHTVTIVDLETESAQTTKIAGANWVTGDCCDPDVLENAGAREADVFVASTGDDQSNLVATMLAKSEFGIMRTIARINHPKNAHLFDESWGVDLSVSIPEAMTALIEETVFEDKPFPIFKFAGTNSSLVKLRISSTSEYIGMTKGEFLAECKGLTLCAVLRENTVFTPNDNITIEAGDEIILIASNK